MNRNTRRQSNLLFITNKTKQNNNKITTRIINKTGLVLKIEFRNNRYLKCKYYLNRKKYIN